MAPPLEVLTREHHPTPKPWESQRESFTLCQQWLHLVIYTDTTWMGDWRWHPSKKTSWVICPILCRGKRVRIKHGKNKAKQSPALWLYGAFFRTLQGHPYEHAHLTSQALSAEGRKGLGRICISRETQKVERLPFPRGPKLVFRGNAGMSLQKHWLEQVSVLHGKIMAPGRWCGGTHKASRKSWVRLWREMHFWYYSSPS